MTILIYVARRFLYLIPQAIGISVVTFVIVRQLPGNPAITIAGPMATEESIRAITEQLGLDKPIWTQYYLYMRDLLNGNFGTSWVTSNPVAVDIMNRLPATLELISIGLILALIIGMPLGVVTALRPAKGIASRATLGYSMLAGAIPDFWLGLILIFIFYFVLQWFPAPIGRIGLIVTPPTQITGMYTIDSLLTGNWEAFRSVVAHLALPVTTLVFVYMAPIVKFTRESMEEVLKSNFVLQQTASGLRRGVIVRKALRNALPPVVTILGVLYGYLLGGAVLIESVFSWGGLGQYAVQSITNADFAPIQAFMLVAAAFTLVVYLLVDLAYFALDPRIRT